MSAPIPDIRVTRSRGRAAITSATPSGMRYICDVYGTPCLTIAIEHVVETVAAMRAAGLEVREL